MNTKDVQSCQGSPEVDKAGSQAAGLRTPQHFNVICSSCNSYFIFHYPLISKCLCLLSL